jgi:hypothetical protein
VSTQILHLQELSNVDSAVHGTDLDLHGVCARGVSGTHFPGLCGGLDMLDSTTLRDTPRRSCSNAPEAVLDATGSTAGGSTGSEQDSHPGLPQFTKRESLLANGVTIFSASAAVVCDRYSACATEMTPRFGWMSFGDRSKWLDMV